MTCGCLSRANAKAALYHLEYVLFFGHISAYRTLSYIRNATTWKDISQSVEYYQILMDPEIFNLEFGSGIQLQDNCCYRHRVNVHHAQIFGALKRVRPNDITKHELRTVRHNIPINQQLSSRSRV